MTDAERRVDVAVGAVTGDAEPAGHSVDVDGDLVRRRLDEVDAVEAVGDETVAGEAVGDLQLAAAARRSACAGARSAGCASRSAPRRARRHGAILRRVGEGGGQSGEAVGVLVGERLGERGQAVAVEERRVGVAGEERRMAQDAHEQVAVGDDAVDAGPLQRTGERPGGLGAARRVAITLASRAS